MGNMFYGRKSRFAGERNLFEIVVVFLLSVVNGYLKIVE
jgi:hypothetical protein